MHLATASQHAHDAPLATSGSARREHAPRSAAGPLSSRNRRRHPRVASRGIAGHLHGEGVSVAGLAVENISLGGLFVRSATALPVGTRVMLQLVRPGLKRAIQLTGRVVSVVTPADARVRGTVAGMCVGFDPHDADGERRLAALLDDLTGGAVSRAEAQRAPEAAVIAPAVPVPVPAAVPALGADLLELAEAKGTIAEQGRRLAALEAELKALRAELLRRNRTVGDLARRLAVHEDV